MSSIKTIFWTLVFLWMVTSGSSTLPSFDWASKKVSHPSQLTREDRSRYGSESTLTTARHTSLPHVGFLNTKSERCQLFCLSRRHYLTGVAFWANWMGFIDLVSSNWTAPSHVGGKGGVRLDSLHYTFIMISLPDVTQNVFSLDSVTRWAAVFRPNCRIKAGVFIETNHQYSDRRITQITPDSKTKSLTGSWMFGKWVPSCLLYLLHPKSCFPYYAWSCFN